MMEIRRDRSWFSDEETETPWRKLQGPHKDSIRIEWREMGPRPISSQEDTVCFRVTQDGSGDLPLPNIQPIYPAKVPVPGQEVFSIRDRGGSYEDVEFAHDLSALPECLKYLCCLGARLGRQSQHSDLREESHDL